MPDLNNQFFTEGEKIQRIIKYPYHAPVPDIFLVDYVHARGSSLEIFCPFNAEFFGLFFKKAFGGDRLGNNMIPLNILIEAVRLIRRYLFVPMRCGSSK